MVEGYGGYGGCGGGSSSMQEMIETVRVRADMAKRRWEWVRLRGSIEVLGTAQLVPIP